MSDRLVNQSSFLCAELLANPKPAPAQSEEQLSPARRPLCRSRASLLRRTALLLVVGALGLNAAAQSAHFSGARTKAAGNSAAHPEQAPPAGNFGAVNVGTTSAPVSLTFTFDAAVTLGSISVLTQGAPNLDFANAGTGTCTAGAAYSSGNTCTVDVTFAPTLAGVRYGGTVLYDNSGNAIATGYLQGTGNGPQVNFLPGTESTIGSGIDMPGGIVVDGAGNVFISDSQNNHVVMETPSAGGYTQSVVFTGLNTPGGLAVDGAGNIYLTDDYNDRVLKESLSAGGYTQTTIGSGMNKPNGLAVDGSGNVYIADAYNGRVLMETLSGGAYTQSVILTCGGVGYQSCPSAVAVDETGDLFITAYNMSQVLELTPSAGGYIQSSIGSGLVWPSYIAIDGSGNLYIADTLNNRVVKETPTASGYAQSVVSSSGLYWPWALAVDGQQNVYIADTYHNRVLKEDYWDPPSLNFSTGNSGPQTVTVANAGDDALSFPVPGSGENPSISSDFTLDTSAATACPVVSAGASSPGTLTAGASCTLTISPSSAGTFSGSLVLTDNNLNAPAPGYTTQTIPLASVVSSVTALTVSATQVQVGQPITLTATVSVPSGSGTPTGTVTFQGAGSPSPAVTLNGSGVAAFTSSTLPIGSYSVTAVYSGDATHLGSQSTAAAFTVTGFASQTTLSASAAQLQSGQSLTLTATVTAASGGTPTGNVTFAGIGSPSPTATLNGSGVATYTTSSLPAGNYGATANYGGDATHSPSQSQPVYFAVAAGPPAKVIPVGSSNQAGTYGAPTGICAEVTDAGGDPVAGITITFGGAGLSFTPSSGLSNTSGQVCTTVSALPVGNYAATASVTGISTPATFNLTVAPAPLQVTVRPARQKRTYGSPNPVFTANVSGLVNGDTLGGTIVVTISSSATQSTPVGTYPVSATVGGSAASNYAVAVQNAELEIEGAPLRVSAPYELHVFRYGQTIPPPDGYTVEGFVNGDTQGTALTGEPVITNTATSTSPVGRYAIDIAKGTLSAQNYFFYLYKGVLEIYRAQLTVTATNFTIQQGQPIPTLTYSITGFVNGETQSVVTGTPILYTPATSSSPPGVYPIQLWPGTLKAPNYQFPYSLLVNGTITIQPSGN